MLLALRCVSKPVDNCKTAAHTESPNKASAATATYIETNTPLWLHLDVLIQYVYKHFSHCFCNYFHKHHVYEKRGFPVSVIGVGGLEKPDLPSRTFQEKDAGTSESLLFFEKCLKRWTDYKNSCLNNFLLIHKLINQLIIIMTDKAFGQRKQCSGSRGAESKQDWGASPTYRLQCVQTCYKISCVTWFLVCMTSTHTNSYTYIYIYPQ